jgi:glycosyltransferase involved in cell wall biosynthesis
VKVIYSIGSKLAGGGIGSIAYHAVEGVSRNGHPKKVITLDREAKNISPQILDLHHNIRFPLYRISWLLPRHRFYAWKNYYFDRMVKCKLSADADIFHGWTCQSLASIKKAKQLGLTVFIDRASMHVNLSDRLITEEYKQFGVMKNLPLDRVRSLSLEEYALTDFIIVPSQRVYDSFLEEGVDQKKLILVPFGVDLEKFKPGVKKDDVFRLLFVGQIGVRKGVHYLLKAWKELGLKNAELVLVGEDVDDIRNLIKLDFGKYNIKMPGFISDMPRFYTQASVFVLPSIEEGSALVSYEAMASGLPVIVTENVGSVARDGIDGFVIPIRDVTALKEKILFLYEQQDKMAHMGIQARKSVEQFSWERYGDGIARAYQKMESG